MGVTMRIIPLYPELYDWRAVFELDGRDFSLRVRWDDRGHGTPGWYADLRDAVGAPLRMGERVIVGVPLFGSVADRRAPKGMFLPVARQPGTPYPDLNDPGRRVMLVYFDAADVAALTAAAPTARPPVVTLS